MGAAHKSRAHCFFLPLAPCAWLQSNFLINGCAQIQCLAAEISVSLLFFLPAGFHQKKTPLGWIDTHPPEINFLSSQALKSKAGGGIKPTAPREDCTLTGFMWRQTL